MCTQQLALAFVPDQPNEEFWTTMNPQWGEVWFMFQEFDQSLGNPVIASFLEGQQLAKKGHPLACFYDMNRGEHK